MLQNLGQIAQKLVSDGKGILAADESTATIKKRFDQISVLSTNDSRRDYREMLFSTMDAMHDFISGVILFDETIRQDCRDGRKITDLLRETDTLIGIKVDTGAKNLALFDNETITEGLDGLRERLIEYHSLGATFAKWRAVIKITERTPTNYSLAANAHALSRYAALCQEVGIVPIVEPEILMDSHDSHHTIKQCFDITSKTLSMVFDELINANVALDGIILKPNMIIPGIHCSEKVGPIDVAKQTLKCLEEYVPKDVPGICFLSGGQSDIEATRHLSLMNELKVNDVKLSFSYGRALQQSALLKWKGKEENIPEAQQAFKHRAKMNSLASLGEWQEDLE
jgi:fructose-bisphosphate aldolase class I